MATTLTLTRTFPGLPLTLETARIVQIDDLVSGPDSFGIARRPGVLDQDFPTGWIQYAAPEGAISYYTLQSAAEIRAALADNVADLHSDPRPFARLKTYLLALKDSGVETTPVYVPFGTPDAEAGAWEIGLAEGTIMGLIEALERRRPLKSLEGLDL